MLSVLIVVAIMALLWLKVVESTPGTGCPRAERTGTTLSPELTKGLAAGVAKSLNC